MKTIEKKTKQIHLRETSKRQIVYVLSRSSRPSTLALVYKYIFMVPYVLCAREQDPVFACASRFYNREKKMMKKKERENKRNKS